VLFLLLVILSYLFRRTKLHIISVLRYSVSTAAFFKHDSQGNYIIQSASRFDLTNGVLSLNKKELDLYPDMCMQSQYLSHDEVFQSEKVIGNVSAKLKRTPPQYCVSDIEQPEEPLRIFGRKIFDEENMIEVNKFTKRTHKQEFLTETEVNLRGALKKELSKMFGKLESFDSSGGETSPQKVKDLSLSSAAAAKKE
jgi:hypothetical protein